MTPNPDSPTGTAPEAVKAFKPSTLVAGIPLVPLPADFQGKWVVLDDDQETIRAVADTFPEILGLAQQLGLVDSVIERAPGLHPTVARRPFELLLGESANVLEDVQRTIPDADQWLDTPNTRLWCKKPRELVGTPQEGQLRYLLRGIWSGITS